MSKTGETKVDYTIKQSGDQSLSVRATTGTTSYELARRPVLPGQPVRFQITVLGSGRIRLTASSVNQVSEVFVTPNEWAIVEVSLIADVIGIAILSAETDSECWIDAVS